MRALEPLQRRLGYIRLESGRLHACNQIIQVVHDESGMGFARRTEIRFNTQMQLGAPGLKPNSAAFVQPGRLREFCKPKQVDEKSPRPVLLAGRHGHLDMVDRANHGLFDRVTGIHPRFEAAQDGIGA